MKKKIVCLFMCTILGITVMGCGKTEEKKNNATDNTTQNVVETTKGEESKEEAFSIKMNKEYTFTDPEDLEFDKRYVLKGDSSSKLMSDMKNYGYNATNMYEILYVKNGEAVKEYQFFVCPDKTSATDLAEFYESQGQEVTQEGSILYACTEKDVLQAHIISYSSMGMMSGETPEDYISFLQSFQGLMEY